MLKKTFFMTVLVLGLLLAVTTAVGAAGPIIDKGSGTETHVDTWCPGFDIEHTLAWTYTDKYFFSEGELVKIKTHVNGQDLLVNMVTGKELTGNYVANETYTFDGDTTYWHSSGIDWNITYPGFGTVMKQEGTVFVEFPADGSFIIHHMSSSHADGFFGLTDELCAALGD